MCEECLETGRNIRQFHVHVKKYYKSAKERLRELLIEYKTYEMKREKIYRKIYVQVKILNEKVEKYDKVIG